MANRFLGIWCSPNAGRVKCCYRLYSSVAKREVGVKYLSGDGLGIAVLEMNSPEKRNALSKNFIHQYNESLQEVKDNRDIRVLIIRSMLPKVFCAGADLKERLKMDARDVAPFVRTLRQLTVDVQAVEVPTIAAIDGAALGGGLEIALSCDMRVASATAKMGLVETRLAIFPGAGGCQRLTRIVGPALTKELVFTARVFDGKFAENKGIVNYSVEPNIEGNAAYSRCVELAKEILPNGPLGVKLSKYVIDHGLNIDLDSALAMDHACYSQLSFSKDRVEALSAFSEKRTPIFTGE